MTSARSESRAGAVASGNDPAAFERCVEECQRVVYQIALSVLANAADAEEVTQEVFLRAYYKIASLRDPTKFRAWVARMSWRLALNRKRSSTRTLRRDTAWLESAAPPVSPEELASTLEFHSRLREEIGRLPDKLRDVLLLCAIQGLDARAVSEILGIPEGTVRSRLYLARKQLLRRLPP